MEDYWIDPRLKQGKHYPTELTRLIEVFNGKRIMKHVGKGARRVFSQQEREVRKIKGMFERYFFYQSRMVRFQKYFDTVITQDNKDEWNLRKIRALRKEFSAKWKEEFPSEKPGEVIGNIIKKVNGKLRFANPQLLKRSLSWNTFYLEPIAIVLSSMGAKKKFFSRNIDVTFTYWELLAKVIDGLNPRLIRKCAYCEKIYFSLQRKKFHTECRSRYFSEKYGKEGRNAERQKQYRQRKQKKLKARTRA